MISGATTAVGVVTGAFLTTLANTGGLLLCDTFACCGRQINRTLKVTGVLCSGALLTSAFDHSDFSKGMKIASLLTSIYFAAITTNNGEYDTETVLWGLGCGILGAVTVNPITGIFIGGIAVTVVATGNKKNTEIVQFENPDPTPERPRLIHYDDLTDKKDGFSKVEKYFYNNVSNLLYQFDHLYGKYKEKNTQSEREDIRNQLCLLESDIEKNMAHHNTLLAPYLSSTGTSRRISGIMDPLSMQVRQQDIKNKLKAISPQHPNK